MINVLSYIKKILNTGVSRETDPFDKRRIQLINFIVFTSIVVGAISEVFTLYTVGFVWEGFLMYFSAMVLLGAMLYSNFIKKYKFSRILIAISANLPLLILMAYWDPNLRVSQFYFVNFVIYLAIFKKYKSIIFWSVITFGVFVIGTYLQVYNVFTPVFAPAVETIPFFRFMFIGITCIFLFLFTLFFKKGSDDYQTTLNQTNKKLQEALETINERNVKLQESISEKEILLREVNHRVKNNLQVISSLLGLQFDKGLNPKSYSVLEESKNRVAAMALVHEKLYLSTNLEQVDFQSYIYDLILSISQSRTTTKVSTELSISDIKLSIDQMIHTGLIINELVTNSYKHVFDENKYGELAISLQNEEGTVTLIVQDNGSGLPDDFELESFNDSKLGIKLVKLLCKQLKGRYLFENENGLKITITFPA